MFSTALSSASLASTLSVVGLPAAIPLGGAGGAFGAASLGLIIASKKLDWKIKKAPGDCDSRHRKKRHC